MAIANPAESAPDLPIPPDKPLDFPYALHKRLLDAPVPPNPEGGFPEEDGVPLETDWHRVEMNLLIECVTCHFQPRDDYFVGGNMFIFFDEKQARNTNVRGPDFFFVRDTHLNPPRRHWLVWEENYKCPNVIVELTSPSTANIDRTIKKDIYEKIFRTKDYFIVNPDDNTIRGWHLVGESYVEIVPDQRGWLWCAELGMWLGNWHGKFQGKINTYARFFDTDGRVVPLFSEVAEVERKLAEAERRRAYEERLHADEQRQRAETERQRADALEAELAKLKAQLGQQPKNGKS